MMKVHAPFFFFAPLGLLLSRADVNPKRKRGSQNLGFTVFTLLGLLNVSLQASEPPPKKETTANATAEKPPGEFRAGTALVDITPTKFPVIVNGGFLEGSAKAVVDPLHARALVLANDQTTLAIVVVDSCMLPRELLDRAKDLASKATGIPTDRMLISATHTHTAPSAMGALGSRPDPDYPEFLIPLLARAIETAHQKLQPAQLGWGVIDDYEHTFHRRWIYRADKMLVDPFGEKSVRAMMNPGHMNPDVVGPSGPVDPGLTVVGIKTREGKPLAVLANYSMHYYGSPALSADYYGRFCAKMRQAIVGDEKNDDFLAIMSQGTSGDLNAIDTEKPAKPRDIDSFAQGIADNALKVYRKLEYKDQIPLAMSESLLKLKRRVPDEKRLAWAKEKIAAMGDRRPKDKPEVYALEAVMLHDEPERELKLQALRLGDLAITAMPNEVFALTGLKLKKFTSLKGTMNISLANGSEGYIPPPEQHALGGYTTWAARTAALVPYAEHEIALNLLKQLYRLSNSIPTTTPSGGRYTKEVYDSKPTAFWQLEDLSGNNPNDLAENFAKATIEPGYALYLDGPQGEQISGKETNHAVHFAGGRLHAEKNLSANYTTEFWLWNGLPHDARPVTAYLFSRGDPSDKEANGDHLGIGGTHRGQGRLIFFNGNTQQELLVGQTELKLKHWHHVVLVREGTRVTVYLDGNPEPDIGGSAKVTYAKDGKDLFFAGRSDKFALLEGKLDEISLYDRALPTEEVLKHAKAAGLEPPPAKQSRALSPAESQKTLHLPPGLRAELVAAEPEVQSPIAMAFDERGRLWVVEMIDYPNGPKPGEPGQSRIKLLRDLDEDGCFEDACVFADKLLFANGLLPYRDGVIVTAAGEILWLRDTDDDGVCDKREVLYKGFATGNPQLRVSHPILLPDGRICVVNGLRGGKIVRGGETPGEPIDISGRDFAFDPRRGTAEAITGMGQYGNTLDDAGNRFVCTNRNHWIHIGLDEKYLKRNPWMAVPPRAGDNQAPGGAARIFPLTHQVTTANEHQGTFTAACGVHVYRGIGLPAEYRGAIFTCEPTGNLVHHEILVPHGSTFIGKPGLNGQEFLASTDPWFRPVFLAGGPDGALYVTDMYRKVIEHPEWLPPSLRNSPDFDEGKERGRIWRIVAEKKIPLVMDERLKESAQLPLTVQYPSRLLEVLYHPDGWWQTTAQRLAFDTKLDEGYARWLQSRMMTDKSASGTAYSAYLLRNLGLIETAELLAIASQYRHPIIKLHTMRLCESTIQEFLNHKYAAYSSTPAIACQFAASLGNWDDDRILQPLTAILEQYHDDPQVRLAVLSSVATRSGKLVERLLQDHSTFRVLLTQSKLQFLSDLAAIVAARRDPDELALLLDAAFAVDGNSARRIQLAIRRGLIDGATRRGEQLPAVLARLPKIDQPLADKVTKLADESLVWASEGISSSSERLAAIADCAQLDWAKVRPVLAELLHAKHDRQVRVAAVRALATFTKPEVAPALVAAWDKSPEYQAAALDALLAQPDRTLALLAALESGTVDARAVDSARQTLLTHRRRDIRERAAAIFAAVPTVERQAVVKEYQPALKLVGDPRRGKELFRGKATCAQCHRAGDVGHTVGPNLSELRTKTPAMLLNDILDPNGAIDANFVNYSVTLTSGKTLSGIIAAESANSLTLRRAENQTETITRTDIELDGLVNTRRSLMPEGVEKTLNTQEMADLLAYLQRWRELP
jgi:putative membrane-bound dehydrogenase-like protein